MKSNKQASVRCSYYTGVKKSGKTHKKLATAKIVRAASTRFHVCKFLALSGLKSPDFLYFCLRCASLKRTFKVFYVICSAETLHSSCFYASRRWKGVYVGNRRS